ncbi:class I SAM-dependent methyltransferase [Deinococcus yavapaiensis]|uniref:Methyltransferase family protein n=1 Tax=Deinococcus yavapaiensis KR-236 TaxID=694435 RepID=A0A318S4U8_9DEIO|nr:class I SAM-dependent methyltransferase [Deinococcus yavapaiensis]PYE50493.1 methyltransferase family protein [Deinococcus yavapaiensis KR-236]
MTQPQTDMNALKARLKATWMSGDYSTFATPLLPGALEFLKRADLKLGERMLDVGCGAGQTAIPAAQAGAIVTGVDIATNLIEHARERARKEQVDVTFEEGDAEDLQYPDASFDVVLSLFAAMFAPRPDLVAKELTRVCRRGGRIVMGNWTPTCFIGQMFKVIGRHVPPAPMPSPLLWGNEDTVRERLGDRVRDVVMTHGSYQFDYPFSPERTVEFFATYYGPTNRAFAVLDEAGQAALKRDLTALWSDNNQAQDGRTIVYSDLLTVQAIRA